MHLNFIIWHGFKFRFINTLDTVLLIYGLAMLPFSGSWLESRFFLQMSYRHETNCEVRRKINWSLVAEKTKSGKRNEVIEYYLCAFVHFSEKTCHHEGMQWKHRLSSPLFSFCNTKRENQQLVSVWQFELLSQQSVYLNVGQVQANVRFCPNEIKTDVL